MSGNGVRADLAAALELAKRADAITMDRFGALDLRIDTKPDLTPVTDADEAVEAELREILAAQRPGDAVFGEEYGGTAAFHGRQWVIDPIDGTSGFVRGIPIWATLIALVHADRGPLLGVVSAPALGRRWWGGLGLGATVSVFGDERPIVVSTVDDLHEAQVSITHNHGWDALGLTPALVRLQQQARRSRGIGDFWQHMLVAEGAMDVAVDAVGVAPYDIAAVKPIVEAAGGSLTDRHGVPTHLNNTAISSNRLLHDTVIAALAG